MQKDKQKPYGQNWFSFAVSSPLFSRVSTCQANLPEHSCVTKLFQSSMQRLVPSPFHLHTQLLRDLGELAG